MATVIHQFDWPDRIVVGTIGAPGERAFYLQARAGARVTSVALEKEQSAVLAEKVEEILDRLMAEHGNPFSVPGQTPAELVDDEPLEQPVAPEFAVGTMALGWDPTTSQIVIEAYPIVEIDADEDQAEPVAVEPPEAFVARIPVGTARAFAKRTREIVNAGRPICPRCGMPMDPGGHTCPAPDDR